MEKSDRPLVVLLGGAGYIGTHIMLELHGKYQVVVIDIRPPNPQAISYLETKTDLPVIHREFDLMSREPIETWPKFDKSPEFGIMLAALKDVNEGERIPHEYISTNITLCVNSMKYLSHLCVKKFIQASSSTVYYHEDAYPFDAIGTYGYSKQITERICERLKNNEQELVILRYMNPIGSHPDVDAFPDIGVCEKLTRMPNDQIFINYGDCIRDYIHITDLAKFHLKLLEFWDSQNSSWGSPLRIMNVGSGTKTCVSELVRLFSEHTGRPARIVKLAERRNYEGYDTVRITNPKFDWKPIYDLPRALSDYRRRLSSLTG